MDEDGTDWENEILFAGYRLDTETGLHHVRHRYYHSALGRWTSRDPAGYVDGMSLYVYVGGEPINARDPLGLAAWTKAPKDGAPCSCKTEKGDCVVRLHEYPRLNGWAVTIGHPVSTTSLDIEVPSLDNLVGAAIKELGELIVKKALTRLLTAELAKAVLKTPGNAVAMIENAMPTLKTRKLLVGSITIDGIYVDKSCRVDMEVEYETITCGRGLWRRITRNKNCCWDGWDDEDWENDIRVRLGYADRTDGGPGDEMYYFAWKFQVAKMAVAAIGRAKKTSKTLQLQTKEGRAKAVLDVLGGKLGCSADKALIGDD